ncbi:MAG TPA: hypothetical protein VHC41_03450, partial [Mycobacteriales bacterium]|nr:hypothetical protein [Mycobacteriales bacterium]
MTTQAEQASFGMNEWLVQELYQSFLQDPGSVDPVWQEYFTDFPPAATAGAGDQTPTAAAQTVVALPADNDENDGVAAAP